MSYYDGYSQLDEDDGNYYIGCIHCDAEVLSRNMNRHLEKVHKCWHCNNYMPNEAIDGHIQRKHIITCDYCSAEILENEMDQHEQTHFFACRYCPLDIHEDDMDNHVRLNHALVAIIGVIQLQRISDNRFNQLVAANQIYSKDGLLFIKFQ